MKRFIFAAFLLISALPALITQTNIGHKTNFTVLSNSAGVFSRPLSNTNYLLAAITNNSEIEFKSWWGQWIYGTVLSGSRSNENGYVWYEILNTNWGTFLGLTNTNGVTTNTNFALASATNYVSNLGGAFFSSVPRSLKREPGNKKFFVTEGTKITIISNLTDWTYSKINSGSNSNTFGYFPMSLIYTNVSGTNVDVTNRGGALRTAPVFPAVGPSMGKKFYLPAGTRFLSISNTSTFFVTSRNDFTNGFHTNFSFYTLAVLTNFYTNVFTNQR